LTWSELQKKCKRESDYIITLFITNNISLLLTWVLVKTRVTPNQVTIASIVSGLLCGLCYASGWFIIGSIFLFISHILDCTDGNLARITEIFSPLGKWLDMFSDRFVEAIVFISVSIYFFKARNSELWVILTLIDAVLLALYYYIVDIALALGLSKPVQDIHGIKYKDVRVKWGIMEPVIYSFVILAPLGFIRIQIVLVFLLVITGLTYQVFKRLLSAKA
jgi:phosphatidylglycerophosphate synthase